MPILGDHGLRETTYAIVEVSMSRGKLTMPGAH